MDPAPRPLKVVGAYALFVGMALMALGVLFRAYGVAPLEAYRVFLSVLGDPLGLAEVARRAIPSSSSARGWLWPSGWASSTSGPRGSSSLGPWGPPTPPSSSLPGPGPCL